VVDVSSSERTTAAIARGQREGILIVDDEPQIRDVLGRALEAFGYRVRVAADGREGSTLYAAHAQDIDLIVADMMMPIMDGPAMIRAIRDLNAEVPIVAMSGLADADAARRLEGLGVAELLTKPFTTDALLELLARELAGRRTN
jgi:CheY-like chemotaxis protein